MTTYDAGISGLATGLECSAATPSGITGFTRRTSGTDWRADTVDVGGDTVIEVSRTVSGGSDVAFDFTTPGAIAADTDTEVLVKWRATGGAPVSAFKECYLRRPAGSSVHYALWHQTSVRTWMSRWNGVGTQSNMFSNDDFTLADDTWYWTRVRVSATTTGTWEFKFWEDSGSEPGTWEGSANDTNTDNGYVGFAPLDHSYAPYQVAHFSVGTDGDAAPGPSAGGAGAILLAKRPMGALLQL